jgi:hypothetical protein
MLRRPTQDVLRNDQLRLRVKWRLLRSRDRNSCWWGEDSSYGVDYGGTLGPFLAPRDALGPWHSVPTQMRKTKTPRKQRPKSSSFCGISFCIDQGISKATGPWWLFIDAASPLHNSPLLSWSFTFFCYHSLSVNADTILPCWDLHESPKATGPWCNSCLMRHRRCMDLTTGSRHSRVCLVFPRRSQSLEGRTLV